MHSILIYNAFDIVDQYICVTSMHYYAFNKELYNIQKKVWCITSVNYMCRFNIALFKGLKCITISLKCIIYLRFFIIIFHLVCWMQYENTHSKVFLVHNTLPKCYEMLYLRFHDALLLLNKKIFIIPIIHD